MRHRAYLLNYPAMRFDVVMPAFNEAAHIDAALDSVFASDWPDLDVYVVDAGSEDDTVGVLRRRPEPNLHIITGRGRLNAAQAFNAGCAEGAAPWIARVDAHSTISPDYLRRAAEAIEEEGAKLGCVGGQPEQAGETAFGCAVALARASKFGVGGSVYSDRRERAYVDTVQCGVYSRAALDAVGGFRTDMLVGEDEEVNWRLKQAGYTILLDTALRFVYVPRGDWNGLFRQHRNYGKSRVRVLSVHPQMFSPRHMAPAVLVGGLAVLAGAAPVSRTARWGFAGLAGAYAGGAMLFGRAAAKEQPELASMVSQAFAAMHGGYGVGLIEGGVALVRARLGGGELETAVKAR